MCWISVTLQKAGPNGYIKTGSLQGSDDILDAYSVFSRTFIRFNKLADILLCNVTLATGATV